MSQDSLTYDASYQEEVKLRDGTPVQLRMLRRSDKDALRRGFAGLSKRSRYLRFFTAKTSLSDRDLERLVDVDGVNHVAIAAATQDPDGQQQGLGVARFHRLTDEPTVAEPAIAVVDSCHGQGLGTILLQRIIAAARERGIRRFRSEVLDENDLMKRMLKEMSPEAWFARAEHGVTLIDIPLPKIYRGKNMDPEAPEQFLQQLLSHIAQDNIVVRTGSEILGLLKGDDWKDP